MSALRTYNVEAGLPTLDEARRLVIEEIKRAKREGVKVLKVIHGYGSSGKGGALYVGLRKSFGLRKKEAVIKDFIAGEDFSIFNDTVLALLEAVPELRGDPDLGATNEGVTLYGAEIHLLRQQMAEYLLNSRGLLMALCCRRDEHRRPDFDQPLDCQNSPAFQLRPRFGE